MKFNLPRNECSLLKVTARAGDWSSKMMLEGSHATCDVVIPEGVEASEVTVTVEFCDGQGRTIDSGVILQEGKEKAKPKPEQPKPEPLYRPRKSKYEPYKPQEVVEDGHPTDPPITAPAE